MGWLVDQESIQRFTPCRTRAIGNDSLRLPVRRDMRWLERLRAQGIQLPNVSAWTPSSLPSRRIALLRRITLL
ncbi:MAG TPA: hypothetical protein PKK83_04890, partial [Polyangiaceae bacterium]|nr:hypothetical protein [Polyangiaceae bacterium]